MVSKFEKIPVILLITGVFALFSKELSPVERNDGWNLTRSPRDLEVEISLAHGSSMGRTEISWEGRLLSHEAMLSI